MYICFDINLQQWVDDCSLSFEIRARDLLGRIGRVETKSGVFETPILLPVVNPIIQVISPKTMQDEFCCEAIITNAYIIKKRYESKALEIGVHRLLDFEGAIMTDSGAYQILVYGDVETTNREIIGFQEQTGADIATILDVPTGWGVSEQYAKATVKETVKRAKELIKMKSRKDTLWVGPIQGGVYLNCVTESAKAMSGLPFQIHALGSPTPVMEQYLFDTLVDMIMAAKLNLPPDRPLHLFGAGHPFMFSLAVALGCDLFDSAATRVFIPASKSMTLAEARQRGIEEIERNYLKDVLTENRGRISDSAAEAGISSRQLNKLMNKYGLKKEMFKSPQHANQNH